VLARASGAFGSSLDYLERTRVALVAHGIVDPYLERAAATVARLRNG
jgi:cation transport regulator ChaC